MRRSDGQQTTCQGAALRAVDDDTRCEYDATMPISRAVSPHADLSSSMSTLMCATPSLWEERVEELTDRERVEELMGVSLREPSAEDIKPALGWWAVSTIEVRREKSWKVKGVEEEEEGRRRTCMSVFGYVVCV